MTTSFKKQKNRLIVIIVTTLIPFLTLVAYYIYQTQSKQIYLDAEKRIETEINLLGEFVTDSLLRHDYAEARNFLNRWVKNEKSISHLEVFLPNGKQLFLYGKTDKNCIGKETKFRLEKRHIKIVIEHNTEDLEKILTKLKVVLTLSLLAVSIFFASTLWFILTKWIMNPFKKEIESQTKTIRNYSNNLEAINRSYKALSESNIALIESNSEKELLERVCSIILKDCGYKLVWIGFKEDNSQKSIKVEAYDGFSEGYIEKLNVSWSDESERGRGPAGRAVRDMHSIVINNTDADPSFSPWRDDALQRGYNSVASFPIISNEGVLGVITVYAERIDAFLEEEISLLGELSGNLGFGILALRDRKKVEELSTIDGLTGIFNRRKVDDILNYELDRASRYQSLFSILLIDIDHFKKVNDTFGHIIGDSVLKEFAQILAHSKRSIDSIGRWGGEEFILILPNTSQENTKTIAERLRKTTEEFIFKEAGKITVSIGIATFQEADTLDSLFDRADNALYAAKRGGRNRVQF